MANRCGRKGQNILLDADNVGAQESPSFAAGYSLFNIWLSFSQDIKKHIPPGERIAFGLVREYNAVYHG